MNTAKLRRKIVVIPTLAVLALAGAGATVWSATAQDGVAGSERERVAAAALEAAGGGTVTDVESSDDTGEAYEAEVRMDDGTEVDLALDEDLDVVGQETDDADDDATPDADDSVLSEEERTSAEEAALAEVGGGTVQQVEASDDAGEAFEVDVRVDGVDWDVTLDADYGVLGKTRDD